MSQSAESSPILTSATETLPPDRQGRPIDAPLVCRMLEPREAIDRLRWAHGAFGEGFALTTSFGIQSAVLLHMVSELIQQGTATAIPVIWVDTGYLPPETYRYAEQLCALLSLTPRVIQAEMSPARMEALHGRLWESGSVADLELYNRLRKVEPLDRAFADLEISCWASGVRGRQTEHRSRMQPLEAVRGCWSVRPLLSWTARDVFYYMEEHQLPQHPLFSKGYSTVGDWHTSAPDDGATRGRSTRFGGLKQECGIHMPGLMGEGI